MVPEKSWRMLQCRNFSGTSDIILGYALKEFWDMHLKVQKTKQKSEAGKPASVF
jgi:hypothetical protein